VAVKKRTVQHLATADRNRDIAWQLAQITNIQPSPTEWSVVVGFYAAVHYVNAFLWERLDYEPKSHQDRSRLVNLTAELRPIASSYTLLLDYAYKARYEPGFRLTRDDVIDVLRNDVDGIAQHIRRELGLIP
jgi:hypothetical protein